MPKQRHSQRKKQQKKKFVPVAPAQAVQPAGITQPVKPTAPQRATASGMTTASVVQSDTGGELLRIGILAGIMIVILVVLYFALT